eukprot:CAMPEP_0177775586 /NCGR_PEP_ID=MMETSP0491_2-20121128/14206_1 /TAXON_ID=63592 /ORGANISM="Tetraselmis chuii, Strain PLY429" /LENGTH=122 /DNA_ID=CAMNT_0019294215 /DNA_START=469 /DNA_END=837 /DNA_ORIENTATION=-
MAKPDMRQEGEEDENDAEGEEEVEELKTNNAEGFSDAADVRVDVHKHNHAPRADDEQPKGDRDEGLVRACHVDDVRQLHQKPLHLALEAEGGVGPVRLAQLTEGICHRRGIRLVDDQDEHVH